MNPIFMYCVLSAAERVLGEFSFSDIEIVQEISGLVSKTHHCECNVVIIPANATRLEVYKLEQLTKQMAQRKSEAMPTSVMLFNPEEYEKTYLNHYRGGTCFKGLSVVMASNTMESYLSKLSEQFIFTRSIWLIFTNGSLGESLKTVKLPINSQVWIVYVMTGHMSEPERKITLYEVFRVAEFQPLIHEYIGQWSKKDGLSFISNRLLMKRRRNFQGHTLRVGAVEYWPMISFTHGEAGRNNIIDGYLASVWFELESVLNFTSDIRSNDDRTTGNKQRSGEWTGIIGSSTRGEIDVLLTVVDYSTDRVDVVEYLLPVQKSRLLIYYKPDSTEGRLDLLAMFRPFHSSTWLAIAGVAVIISVIFCMIKKWATNLSLPESEDLREQSAVEICFFVLGAFCIQGCSKVPKLWAARVIFIVTYLTATILLPLYSASLISKLTRRMPSPPPFDEIKDIWNTDYKLLIGENTSYYSFLETHNDPIISDILHWKAKIVPISIGFNTTLRQTCDEKNVALIMGDGLEMNYLMKINSFCTLRTIKREVANVHSSIGMNKHSPYARASNFYILRMMESGILNRIKNTYLLPREKPSTKEESEVHVSIGDVAQAFIILFVWTILSLLILGIEVAHFKIKRNYRE